MPGKAPLVLLAVCAVATSAGGREVRAASLARCTGEARSPIYSVQEPQYAAGYGSVVKSVSFRFSAPDCAQTGGGANYAIGHPGMKAGDFTWSVYLAGSTNAAPQPLFGVGPTDWGAVLIGDPTVTAPSGCEALAITVSYATNRPTSTGSDGPTRQIFIKVEWNGQSTAAVSPACGAKPPATTTTAKQPVWLPRVESAKAVLEQALRYELAAEPLLKDFAYAKAVALLESSRGELNGHLEQFDTLTHVIPPGTEASSDADIADSEARDASSTDTVSEREIRLAERETGETEKASRDFAMRDLNLAISRKESGIDALTRILAANGSG